MRQVQVVALSMLLSACGSDSGRGRARADGGASTGADLSIPFGALDLAGAPDPEQIDPGVSPDNCTDGAKLIYVVDENNMLSSFDAMALAFNDIGTLRCPAAGGATPFSMAIDRNAQAWVLYNSGELFLVDTTTAACKATKFAPGQSGFDNFGMGFVSDVAMGDTETLFVSAAGDILFGGGDQLGRINSATLKLSPVAAINGTPELTGKGDATLWGFFPDPISPRVAQINKKTGAESSVFPLAKIAGTARAWAFAHWGGDFWIFLMRDSDASTSVHRLRPGTKQLSTPLPNTRRTIVGAGVSTCAPITIQ